MADLGFHEFEHDFDHFDPPDDHPLPAFDDLELHIPPPDFDDVDHEAATKMQALQRGRATRKRLANEKAARAAADLKRIEQEEAATKPQTGAAQDEAAALKVQALARGRAERKRAAKLQAARAVWRCLLWLCYVRVDVSGLGLVGCTVCFQSVCVCAWGGSVFVPGIQKLMAFVCMHAC